jgi:hypothetical protein
MKHYLLIYLIGLISILIECNTIADLNVIVTPKEIIGNSSSSWSILKRFDELTIKSVRNSTFMRGSSSTGVGFNSKKEKDKDAFVSFLLNPANFFNQTILNPASGFFKRVSNGINSVVYSDSTTIFKISEYISLLFIINRNSMKMNKN